MIVFSLSPASRDVLFEELSGGTNQWRSNASGFSICGEWLDGKHMVPLLPRERATEMKTSSSSSSSAHGRGSSKFQSQQQSGDANVKDYLVVFGLVENRGWFFNHLIYVYVVLLCDRLQANRRRIFMLFEFARA